MPNERRGKWENVDKVLVPDENGKFSFETLYTCSECGWGCRCEQELGWKYCPNCGAKMMGGADDEND